MIDYNFYCEWQLSDINPELMFCKHCHRVVTIKDPGKDNVMCPTLLKKAADDPNIKGVILTSTSSVSSNNRNFSSWWLDLPQAITDRQLPKDEKIASSQSSEKKCSDAQIEERLNVCKTCEFFKNSSCLKCGCIINRDKNYMNKLYYADKSCPIGKWGPVEVV